MNSGKRSFLGNLMYAFIAQGISLVLSLITSLIIPKVLGLNAFSYWQLFLFYASYVGFFHLGLNDGVYLKYGGISYEDMDKKSLGGQFRISVYIQVCIAFIIIIGTMIICKDDGRIFVLIATAIYMVMFNLSLYLGYIFQAANRTKVYSLSVIIDKMFFLMAVIIPLLLRIENFITYIIIYLVGKGISLIYCIYRGKEIVFSPIMSIHASIIDTWNSMKIGINLTLAAIASMLILGIGRFVIDANWGIEVFGKVSFSLSLSSFVLTFISQISMVLFPALRQTNTENQRFLYYKIRDVLAIVLPMVLLLYIPVKLLLSLWLPEYGESLRYLAILLPICTFDGKMNLLCNTYFKVLRKEKFLFKINIISMSFSFCISFIGTYIFNNVMVVLIGMVVAVAIRSCISEIYLAKLMDNNILKRLIQEIGITIIFMIASWYFTELFAFLLILIVFIGYIILNKNLMDCFRWLLERRQYIFGSNNKSALK